MFIEKCFGILKRRFPALRFGIRLISLASIVRLITCAFVLHNIAQSRGDIFDEDGIEVTNDEEDEIDPAEDSNDQEAADLRDAIAEIFSNDLN